MTRISDMTTLTSRPASGAFVPVEVPGSTTPYKIDLAALAVFSPEGAVGDGIANDTTAFQAMAAAVNAAGGGVIDLTPGATYVVGRQSLVNDGTYMFKPETICNISGCTKPVIIRGNGAKIKFASGLKFGTFNAAGASTSHALPYTGGDLCAPCLGLEGMLTVTGCTAHVHVENIEFDGNQAGLNVGGQFGDSGYQAPGDNLMMFNNTGGESVSGINTHHAPRDGLVLWRSTANDNPGSVFEHIDSHDNGRQSCSIVGGRNYTFRSFRFRRSGRATIASTPGAGCDLESQFAPIRDILFEQGEFADNVGPGIISDAGDTLGVLTRKCRIIGTTNWSAWPAQSGFRFELCEFIGSLVHPDSDSDPTKAAQFFRCTFTDDPAASEYAAAYNSGTVIDINGGSGFGTNVLFDQCEINATIGNGISTANSIIRDSVFNVVTGKVIALWTCRLEGKNIFTSPTTVMTNLSGSTIADELTLNGVRHTDKINVPHGASADGATDDRAIIVAADALGAFDLPAGNYLISSSLTIANDVTFRSGAKLTIPNGVTVTFSGKVNAGIERLFVCTGTGKVVFNRTKTAIGYLEWWGGKPDGATPCDAAWNAAHIALNRVLGQPGDYLFASTPKIPGPHMGFIGNGRNYTSTTNQATRLLISDGSQFGLQLGPDTFPGSINALPRDIEARDFYVSRTVAPVIGSTCVGVRNQFTLHAVIERVISENSMIEFSFYGTVATKCIDCDAARSVAGTGGGTDYWRGFYPDGTASIGAAGGNASLYLIRPSYSCNLAALQTGDSTGILVTSNFTDLFIDSPEGVSCRDDIAIVGNGVATIDAGNCDLRIDHPTSDQFSRYGISISNLAASGIIQINRPYFGPATAATASLNIASCAGTITVTAGEMLHHSAPSVKPVNISSSEGVQIIGLGILESSTAAVTLAGVKNCRIAPMISNKVNTGGVAVALSGTCTANVILPIVKGKASGFTKGIDVTGTADDRNEYNLTGIDSACMTGGSANKLVRNAVQIVATGLTGTNLVSGVVT